MNVLGNPALWVAIAGVVTAVGTLIHSVNTRNQLDAHSETPAAHPGSQSPTNVTESS
jgi:hypothetical protein